MPAKVETEATKFVKAADKQEAEAEKSQSKGPKSLMTAYYLLKFDDIWA